MKEKSHPPDSNRRPTIYETVALPTELGWRNGVSDEGQRYYFFDSFEVLFSLDIDFPFTLIFSIHWSNLA